MFEKSFQSSIQECLGILAARCASCNCMTFFYCVPLQSCQRILCNKKCNFLYTQKKWLVHTNHFLYKYIPSKLHIRNFLTSYLSTLLGYALDLLVTVSSMCYHTSTSVLSTSSSSRGLTTFVGISHLEGGFTLRCLQRLSRPGLATLLCSWRNNRSTSGQSIPVLSY